MSFPPRPFPGGAPFGYAPQPIFFNPIRTFNPQAIQAPVQQKPSVTTTVFVGNITERCTNDFMQKMLEECGKVASWKRIQGVNGKYQAFGFCDFEQPEGTLRALRILNDFQIGEKKLVVKAEDKVRSDLRSWAISRRKEQGKADLKLKDHELPADEDDKNKDEEIRLKILSWIETDHPELLTVAEDGELSESEKKGRKKDDRRRDDRKGRHRSRSSSRGRNDRKRRRSRSVRRKRRRSASSSSRSSGSRSTYSSGSSRSRSRSSSPSHRRRKRSHSRNSDSDVEERRILKRALKAKERAYQDRLGKWEDREKEKARYYDKLDRREKDRKLQIIKESKKLKTFLEDYNDEEDDAKYFRHSELFRRRRDFEKERQQDAKDRLNELAEIEAIKKEIMEQNKLIAEDAEKKAREQHKAQEEAALRKLRGDSGSPNPHHKLGRANGVGESDSSSSSAESEDEKISPDSSSLGLMTTTVKPEQWTTSTTDETRTPPIKEGTSNGGIALKTTTTMVRVDSVKAKLATVFGMEEEEDVDHLRTRKQLKPFEITKEERMENITELEKNKIVKGIISKIPTSKQDLFSYNIPWDGVDVEFIAQRIQPWVLKKVREFIGGLGDEEKSLCDFICDKVKERVNAMQLIEDVKMILDDDAEMFVVKMWRLLIFEAECKATGLKNLPARKELK